MDTHHCLERLAIIETKLDDVMASMSEVHKYIPEQVIIQSERLVSLERTQRSLLWGCIVIGSGVLTAFIAHIFQGG